MICFYTGLTAIAAPVYPWPCFVIYMITRVGVRGAEAAQTSPQQEEVLALKKTIITEEVVKEQGQTLGRVSSTCLGIKIPNIINGASLLFAIKRRL